MTDVRRLHLCAALALVALCAVVPSATADEGSGCDSVIARSRVWTSAVLPEFPDLAPTDWPLTPRSEIGAHIFAVDPSNVDRMFAANDSTVLRTEDGGCSWKKVFSVTDMPGQASTVPCPSYVIDQTPYGAAHALCSEVYEIVISPELDKTYLQVQTGSAAGNSIATSRILESSDHGDSWSPMLPTSGQDIVVGEGPLVLSPSDPETMYLVRAATQWEAGEDRIFVSTDAGSTWEQREPPGEVPTSIHYDLYYDYLQVDPVDPQELWGMWSNELTAQPALAEALYHSVNGGKTWDRVEGIPTSGGEHLDLDVYRSPGHKARIAIVPLRQDDPWLLISDDSGQTWNELPGENHWDETQFGSNGRYLFAMSRTKSLVARYDLRRHVAVIVKEDLFYGSGPNENWGLDLSYIGGRMYFRGNCTGYDPCRAVDWYDGKGT